MHLIEQKSCNLLPQLRKITKMGPGKCKILSLSHFTGKNNGKKNHAVFY